MAIYVKKVHVEQILKFYSNVKNHPHPLQYYAKLHSVIKNDQGCLLSPFLSLTIDQTMRKQKTGEMVFNGHFGSNWKTWILLTQTLILTQTHKQMQDKSSSLEEEEAMEIGLCINANQTKLVKTNTSSNIELNSGQIAEVAPF